MNGQEQKPQKMAAARVVILETYRSWKLKGHLGWGTFKPFTEAYNSGEVIVPPWVRAEYPSIGAQYLGRWWRLYEQHGAAGLLPRYGNRKGQGVFDTDPELREVVLGLRTGFPREDSAEIMARLEVAFAGRKLPSRRSLQRFLASLS